MTLLIGHKTGSFVLGQDDQFHVEYMVHIRMCWTVAD